MGYEPRQKFINFFTKKMKKLNLRVLIITFIAIFCASLSHAQSAREFADIYSDLMMFESPMGIKLRKNVNKSDIAKMKNKELQSMAKAMMAKSYSTEYRHATYEAYLHPTVLGRELTIGDGYSKYENMTGIYLPEGTHIVLADNIAPDADVQLWVPNWERRAPEGIEPTKDPAGWGIHKQTFRLQNGVNIINLKGYGGLAYVYFYSEKPESEKPLEIHFVNGKVNGYFDIAKNNDADWNRLIDNAVYPVIDARGRHIQIAYPAKACKEFAYNRGVDLISNYDSLIYRQQRFLGLVKYNRVPKNRILARVNYNYYMFRDGDGVAYMGTKPGYAMPLVVNPDRVIKGDPCWGFNHEVGHVHQLRPYLNWGGLGEVSNNIVTLYVTTSFGNKSRLSEQNNYKSAIDTIVNQKISYLQARNVFDRLVPFWQLQLYFGGAGNMPDFYARLHEVFRLQAAEDLNTPTGKDNRSSRRNGNDWGDRGGKNPAEYQLNFVKQACVAGKTDLTDFFDRYGFFWVGELKYNDYGNYHYSMTQKMVDECKAEIKAMNLPQPKIDLTTLTD